MMKTANSTGTVNTSKLTTGAVPAREISCGGVRHALSILLAIVFAIFSSSAAIAAGVSEDTSAHMRERNEYNNADAYVNLASTAEEEDGVDIIEHVFPSLDNCTPRNYYYDIFKKRTENGVLERHGYKPYVVDSDLAKYRINEKFYGLNAIEIWVPSGTYSSYGIVISASSRRLYQVIRNVTGISLRFTSKDFKVESGVAYIHPVDENRSILVCTTLDGGDY